MWDTKTLATIKLPQGFKISVWANDIAQARQMAWGDKGTLFVGTFDKGIVYAVTEQGGKRVVKTFVKGLRMPTGVAFQNVRNRVPEAGRLRSLSRGRSAMARQDTLFQHQIL